MLDRKMAISAATWGVVDVWWEWQDGGHARWGQGPRTNVPMAMSVGCSKS